MRNADKLIFRAALLCTLLLSCQSFARIPVPEGMEDLRNLEEAASFIFHAQLISIDSISTSKLGPQEAIANLAVDRWYKGKPGPSTVRMRFSYPSFINGHDCINFQRSSSWLVFAKRKPDGTFVFSDDCEGALPMSAILAPAGGNGLDQLQQDLIAGLLDQDPATRLANIARLGGLKMKSSGVPLRQFIDHGTDIESKWAVYAAFRSGDLTVLPEVERLVTSITGPLPQKHPLRPDFSRDAAPVPIGLFAAPDSYIALEFRWLKDAQAVPSLIRIVQSAKTDFVRACAMGALADLNDVRSVPIAAAYLGDGNSQVRYDALITISGATHEPACALPRDWKETDIPGTIESCKKWWNSVGSARY